MVFIGWLLYSKSNEIFGKKNLDSVVPELWLDDHHDDDAWGPHHH
jgi:hypothetical protein